MSQNRTLIDLAFDEKCTTAEIETAFRRTSSSQYECILPLAVQSNNLVLVLWILTHPRFSKFTAFSSKPFLQSIKHAISHRDLEEKADDSVLIKRKITHALIESVQQEYSSYHKMRNENYGINVELANLALHHGNFYFLKEIHFKQVPFLMNETLILAARTNNIIFIRKFLEAYPNYDLPGNLIEIVSLGHYQIAHIWIQRTNHLHCLHYKFSFLNKMLTHLYHCENIESASVISDVFNFIAVNYAKEKKMVESYQTTEKLIPPVASIKEMILALEINKRFPSLKLHLNRVLMTTFDGNKIPFDDFCKVNYTDPLSLIRFLIKHNYEHPLQIIAFLLAQLCAQQERNQLLRALENERPKMPEKKSELELDNELFLALFHPLRAQFNKEKVIPKNIVRDGLRLNNGKIIAALFSQARDNPEFKCDESLTDLPMECAWKYPSLVYFLKNCKTFLISQVLHDLFEGRDANYLDKTYKQFIISQMVSDRDITLSEIMIVIQQKSAKLFKALTSAKNFRTIISKDFTLLIKLFDLLQKHPEDQRRIMNLIEVAFLYCPHQVNQPRTLFKTGVLDFVAYQGNLSLVKSLLAIKQKEAKEIQVDKRLLKADLPHSISQYLQAIYYLQHLTTVATESFVSRYLALNEEDELDFCRYAKAINKFELIKTSISDYTLSRLESSESLSGSNKEFIVALPLVPSLAADPFHSFPLNAIQPMIKSEQERKVFPGKSRKKKYHLTPLATIIEESEVQHPKLPVYQNPETSTLAEIKATVSQLIEACNHYDTTIDPTKLQRIIDLHQHIQHLLTFLQKLLPPPAEHKNTVHSAGPCAGDVSQLVARKTFSLPPLVFNSVKAPAHLFSPCKKTETLIEIKKYAGQLLVLCDTNPPVQFKDFELLQHTMNHLIHKLQSLPNLPITACATSVDHSNLP